MSEFHDRSRAVPLGTCAPFSLQTPDGESLPVLAAELRCAHVAAGQQELQLTFLLSAEGWQQSLDGDLFQLPSAEHAVDVPVSTRRTPDRITIALRPEVAQLLFAVCADVEEMKDFLEELGPGSLFRRTGSWVLVEPRARWRGGDLFRLDRNTEPGEHL